MSGLSLALGLALSAHLGLDGDYNEVHPHVRAQYGGAIAGLYLNSEDRASAYVGYRMEAGAAFAELGAVTGYSGADVAPFARVGLSLNDAVEVFATPAYETKSEKLGAAIGIEVRFDLWRN